MKNYDGPCSPRFEPLSFTSKRGLIQLSEIKASKHAGRLSPEMLAALDKALNGPCGCWGIPFKVERVVVLVDKPVTVQVTPTKAHWLVFLHTSDIRAQTPGPGGLIAASRGRGALGEHAADYVLCYADGTEARATIRRRHHIGDFERRWGENCFEAVAQHKPYPLRGGQEQMNEQWGWSQTRVEAADFAEWMNWLWAWENPHPEMTITGLRFEPVSGVVVVSAVSIGDAIEEADIGELVENPLRWRPRRKALLRLPAGETFSPDLDEEGLLKQVQIDMGQIISATPRLVYPKEDWPVGYNNQPPSLAASEILLEYTSHPQANVYLSLSEGLEIYPISEIEKTEGDRPFSGLTYDNVLHAIAPAERPVSLRVVEKGSARPVPVKLHLHGEQGEYLAPVDRHRIINPHWFEDYSADFLHITDWEQRQGGHPCTYIDGLARLKLPLGKVYLEISKGFEIKPLRRVIEITPDTEEITIELERVLPWRERGWVSADTHVHFLSPMTALLEGAAEGVNVVNLLASQWGELMTNVGDFDGRTTWGSLEAGGDGEYLVRVGSENRQHVLGHISLLGYRGPLIAPMTTGGPDESALGDPIEILLTEWARQCRAQDGLVVLPHFPNPRAEHAASIVSGQIDALEMTSWHDHYSGIDPYSLSDWYRYLNCGYQVAAVGGTDKMTAATAVGTVRTYAHITGQDFSYESWKQAVRNGETFVTYGPLLDFVVEGTPMGGRIELPAGGGTLDVTWQVASVTVPVRRVELVVNGEIHESVEVAPQGGAGQWRVKFVHSGWMALLVRGSQPGKPEMIAAHSSAVMVIVDGSQPLAAADAVTILDQIAGAMAYLDTVGTRADERAYKRMRLELVAAQRTLHNRLHQAGHFHEDYESLM